MSVVRFPRSALAVAAALLLLPAALATAQGPAPPTPKFVSEDVRTRLGLDEKFGEEGAKGAVEINDGVIAFLNQRFDQALKEFDSARAKDDTLPPGRVMMARLLAAANRLDLARMQLEVAAAERDSKGEQIEEPEVYLTLGRLALAEGRLTDALLEFEKTRSIVVTPDASAGKDNAAILREIYAGLTTVYEQRADWDRAFQSATVWATNAAKADRAQAELRLGRATFMRETETTPEIMNTVESHFQAAYDADKVMAEERATKDKTVSADEARTIDHPKVSLAVLCAQRAGNDTKAANYDKFIKMAEDNFKLAIDESAKESDVLKARSHAAYSNWLRGLNKMADAESQAKLAAELDPKSDALRSLKAAIDLSRKNYKDAEPAFRQMYQKSPSNFFASNGLALTLVGKGDDASLKEAQEIAEMNVRAYGQKSAEALSTLGWVYFNNRRVADAAQALQQAVQVSNNQISADTAYFLANVLWENKQVDQAMQLLAGALQAGSNFLYREEAEEWMKILSNKPGPRGSAPVSVTPTSNTGTNPAPKAPQTPK